MALQPSSFCMSSCGIHTVDHAPKLTSLHPTSMTLPPISTTLPSISMPPLSRRQGARSLPAVAAARARRPGVRPRHRVPPQRGGASSHPQVQSSRASELARPARQCSDTHTHTHTHTHFLHPHVRTVFLQGTLEGTIDSVSDGHARTHGLHPWSATRTFNPKACARPLREQA